MKQEKPNRYVYMNKNNDIKKIDANISYYFTAKKEIGRKS